MAENVIGFDPFKQEQKKPNPKEPVIPDYSNDFMQVARRIKVIEEGVNNLRRKLLVMEQNDLNRHKKDILEQKSSLGEINDLKKETDNLKHVLLEVISELKGCARKEDVEVLKKYINIWNPINFVTEETVQKMIDEKLSDISK